MIGKRVMFLEDFEFNGKLYKKGHLFTVTGNSFRGLDLKDDDGNVISETLFIDHIISDDISEIRDMKIRKDLGL